MVISATRHQLVPVVLFPKRDARYMPRLDLYGFARRVVDRTIERRLDDAWRGALASAK